MNIEQIYLNELLKEEDFKRLLDDPANIETNLYIFHGEFI